MLRKPLADQVVHSVVPARQVWTVLMPSPHNASAFSSFTTICSGVCFENFLMVIHSARPQAADTTQNNPLTTNGPKNPDPSSMFSLLIVEKWNVRIFFCSARYT